MSRESRKTHYARKVIEEDLVWNLFAQLVLALDECHSCASDNGRKKVMILHRDIKPEVNHKRFTLYQSIERLPGPR